MYSGTCRSLRYTQQWDSVIGHMFSCDLSPVADPLQKVYLDSKEVVTWRTLGLESFLLNVTSEQPGIAQFDLNAHISNDYQWE